MGNTESMSLTYSRLPNAVLAFGPASQNLTDWEETQNRLDELNDAVAFVNNCLEAASPFIKLFETIKSYSGPAGTFIDIVSSLIGKTDELQAKISELETSISMTDVNASLLVLRNIINILKDPQTTSTQIVTEISLAVHEFHRLLPKFAGDSILCVKYYLGAPLFVQLCELFKIVILFAKNTPGYNNPDLQAIVNDYQKTLHSFRYRCIRERLRSIYVLDDDISSIRYFFQRTLFQFPEYFTETDPQKLIESSEKVRLKHAKIPWHSKNYYDIFDEWDVRDRKEISFGSLEIHKDDELIYSKEFATQELHARAICTYRRNVIKVMENYFDAANLT